MAKTTAEKPRYVYEYRGSVMHFGREVIRNWKVQTTATSEKQAKSQLLYRAKQELKLLPNAQLTLKGNFTVVA